MTRIRGGDPEEQRLVEAGTLLLNRVALALVADARRGGGFDDEAALLARARELAPKAKLTLRPGGLIELSVPCGKGFTANAEVREDGVVLGGGTGGPTRTRTRRPEEFSPQEHEERRRYEEAEEARRGKPKFHGRRHLRTLAAPAQPEAGLRTLAIEIFEDGFYVDFTYDNDFDPEPLDEEPWLEDPKPEMRLADDLGTDYYEGRTSSHGGSPVSNSTFNFAPTPPAEATVLRITTDSGTVELDLTS